MSESERRRGYAYNRVLIETARVLTPAFADAVVFLSGAQIEMLRNITQYLNRQETYVTEYMPGYYLAPTPADYDDILEIVADLEETLMGNPNTVWGYKDRLFEYEQETSTGEAYTEVDTDPCPSGYVWVVQNIQAYHNGGVDRPGFITFQDGAILHYLFQDYAVVSNRVAIVPGNVTLMEGDFIRWRVSNLPDTTTCYLRVLGYVMKVPE